MEVVLTSPSGVQSVLAAVRNDSGDHYDGWTFTSVKHWGEPAAGTWTLRVRDGIANDAGSVQSWAIAFHGAPVAVLPDIRALTNLGPAQWAIQFDSEPGCFCQVFHSLDLSPRSWAPAGGAVASSSASCSTTVAVDPQPRRGFFRVARIDP